MKSNVMEEVRRIFKPEFLNRVDDIVMFNSLEKDDLFKIIDIELRGFIKRVSDLGYELTITDEAKNFIVEKGYDRQYGARPLKRAIQQYIEDDLAEMMLRAELENSRKLKFDVDKENDKLKCIVGE